jgi:surfactin synthase thioesterase subunit
MTDTNRWLRRFHPADSAATQLLCLSHVGGSASYFYGVSKALSPDIDVLAAQYPGRQDRLAEPCLTSIHDLADQLVGELEPLTGRPITLFGHSMGATLGFEVARRLESAGVPPTALFASGRPAPSRVRREHTYLRDDAGLLAAVRALGGTDALVLADDDLQRMVLPALRADFTAAETYTYEPGPLLNCPIVALTGDNDPRVTIEEDGRLRTGGLPRRPLLPQRPRPGDPAADQGTHPADHRRPMRSSTSTRRVRERTSQRPATRRIAMGSASAGMARSASRATVHWSTFPAQPVAAASLIARSSSHAAQRTARSGVSARSSVSGTTPKSCPRSGAGSSGRTGWSDGGFPYPSER